MFAVSFNLMGNRAKKIMFVSALLIVAFGVIIILPRIKNDLNKPSNGDFSQESARVFYLNTNGWDVDFVSEQIIIIPSKFSQTYEEYNELQKEQGYDLRQFMGKNATLYTYSVKNYDEAESDVRASLLVCDKQIIGADLYLYEQGGFLTTLKP